MLSVLLILFLFAVVINLSDLKKIMREKVIYLLDHKNLDLDVDYFIEGLHYFIFLSFLIEPSLILPQKSEKIPTTTENLAIFIWDQLYSALPTLLFEVKVMETENNFVIYRGE